MKDKFLEKFNKIQQDIKTMASEGKYSTKWLQQEKSRRLEELKKETKEHYNSEINAQEENYRKLQKDKFGKKDFDGDRELFSLKMEAMTDAELKSYAGRYTQYRTDYEAMKIGAEMRKRGMKLEADLFVNGYQNHMEEIDKAIEGKDSKAMEKILKDPEVAEAYKKMAITKYEEFSLEREIFEESGGGKTYFSDNGKIGGE